MMVAEENELFIKASGILEAVEMMLLVCYVCNMAYPKECLNMYADTIAGTLHQISVKKHSQLYIYSSRYKIT